MLLRRLAQHVQSQNWFAVWLDFLIVVVGVFVGLQVSNWNDDTRVQALEQSYLSRVAEEVTANIATFESGIEHAEQSRAALGLFLGALSDPSVSNADLVRHTTQYISIGTFLSDYRPSQATFDDLKSTGNLDIIRNQELRNSLVQLHAHYADSIETFSVNLDWVLPTDGQVYMSFDALRFDSRTARLFPQQEADATAQYILENRDLLARHAALHFWLKVRAIEILNESILRSKAVLHQINLPQ